MPYQPSWLVQVGLSKESVWGTAVAPATFFPVRGAVKVELRQNNLLDEGWTGVAGKDKTFIPGVQWSELDWPDMWFYPDTTPHFIMGMLGVDTVTGTNPYTHTLTLLNTGNPPSYTTSKFDGLVATARQAAGVYFSDVSMKFANPGKFSIAVKGMGKIPTNATKPTASYSSLAPYIPWQAAATIGGSGNTKLIECQLDIKRPLAQIWGFNNTQDQTGIVVSDLEVNLKMTFAAQDYTELNYFINNTQPVVSILFTSGASTLTLQMSKVAFEDPTNLDHGSPYARVVATGRAISNSTDAGTGNSPIKVIAVNAQSTAY